MGSVVRACPDEIRDGFKAFKYYNWFQQTPGTPLALHAMPEAGNIRTLAQFRCGSHQLQCETARGLGPRSTRVCPFCPADEVEDELHLTMCASWQEHRGRFPLVFDGDSYRALLLAVRDGGDVDSSFRLFMTSMSPTQVDQFTGYLKAVFRARKALLPG